MTFFTKLHPCWGVWCPWTCSGAPVHGNQNELRTQSSPLGQEHTSFFYGTIFLLCCLKQYLVFWSPWDSAGWMSWYLHSRQLKPLLQSFCHPSSISALCTHNTLHFGLFSVFQSPKHYFNPWPAEFSVQVWSTLSYFQQTTSLKCRIRLHSTTLTEWSRGCYYL